MNIRDDQLIDRHMAGILRAEEEARLEHLIRTDPGWARQYREAEEMARLLQEGIGTAPAPQAAKQSIHRRIEQASRRPQPRGRLLTWPRALAAAAVVLAILGVYALFPASDLVPVVYADEPWPLIDLARSADVLLLGRMEEENGALGLRLESVLFGDVEGRAFELPDGLHTGQRVAVFGRYDGDRVIRAVAGRQGVVHLDGAQPWEGDAVRPEDARQRVARAADFRTLGSALADLRAFLASDATRAGRREDDGLTFSAAVTARFLGRFPADETRGDLMELVGNAAKVPEARSAGAAGLVEADPVGACRTLLTRILAGPVEMLHAETEDGYVVLRCLHLIQRVGRPDLADDLATLAERVRCPELERAAQAAWKASTGDGVRTPAPVHARPLRLTVNGVESVLTPPCESPTPSREFLVVFRGGHDLADLRALVSLAVGRHLGVLILPGGADDVGAFLRQDSLQELVPTDRLLFLAVDDGRADMQDVASTLPPTSSVIREHVIDGAMLRDLEQLGVLLDGG